MLLRTRLTVVVAAAMLTLGGGLLWAGQVLGLMIERRFVEATTSGLETAWSATVASRLEPLSGVLGRLGEAPGLAAALGGTADIDQALPAEVLEDPRVDRVELYGRDGALLFTTDDAIFAQGTLPRALRQRLLAADGGGGLGGVGSDGGRGLLALAAKPLLDPGGGGGVLGGALVAVQLDDAVAELGRRLGAEVLIVNRRGRALVGTAWETWNRLLEQGASRTAPLQTLRLDELTYDVVSVPIPGYAGPEAARLITIKDATATAGAQRTVETAAVAGTAGLLVVVILWLALELRRRFRPLDRTVLSLRAIAAGDTSVAVEADGRDDEIGRLAGTVESLRRNAENLEALRHAQGRRMRRQASLIRAQMTSLADTVPAEARGEILAELAEIEAPGETLSPDEVAEDTGLIARALQRLTTRVGAQQGELQRLVAELREALAAKTALVALGEQLKIARTLQSSMLPSRPPATEGVAVAGLMRAAEQVGGDFYDYFRLPDGKLAVAVADVSGKGVPAAIFMAITRTLLRATAALEPEPARCLARVNKALAEVNEQLLFVTMVYGVLDPATGRLAYANAGHNPPVLLPAGDAPPLLLKPLGDLCLGVLPDLVFREAELQLNPGDGLFLYTDGITEGMRVGGEEFGTDRLLEALTAGRGLSVEAQAAAAVRAVDDFEAGAEQSDDRTCVVLERSP